MNKFKTVIAVIVLILLSSCDLSNVIDKEKKDDTGTSNNAALTINSITVSDNPLIEKSKVEIKHDSKQIICYIQTDDYHNAKKDISFIVDGDYTSSTNTSNLDFTYPVSITFNDTFRYSVDLINVEKSQVTTARLLKTKNPTIQSDYIAEIDNVSKIVRFKITDSDYAASINNLNITVDGSFDNSTLSSITSFVDPQIFTISDVFNEDNYIMFVDSESSSSGNTSGNVTGSGKIDSIVINYVDNPLIIDSYVNIDHYTKKITLNIQSNDYITAITNVVITATGSYTTLDLQPNYDLTRSTTIMVDGTDEYILSAVEYQQISLSSVQYLKSENPNLDKDYFATVDNTKKTIILELKDNIYEAAVATLKATAYGNYTRADTPLTDHTNPLMYKFYNERNKLTPYVVTVIKKGNPLHNFEFIPGENPTIRRSTSKIDFVNRKIKVFVVADDFPRAVTSLKPHITGDFTTSNINGYYDFSSVTLLDLDDFIYSVEVVESKEINIQSFKLLKTNNDTVDDITFNINNDTKQISTALEPELFDSVVRRATPTIVGDFTSCDQTEVNLTSAQNFTFTNEVGDTKTYLVVVDRISRTIENFKFKRTENTWLDKDYEATINNDTKQVIFDLPTKIYNDPRRSSMMAYITGRFNRLTMIAHGVDKDYSTDMTFNLYDEANIKHTWDIVFNRVQSSECDVLEFGYKAIDNSWTTEDMNGSIGYNSINIPLPYAVTQTNHRVVATYVVSEGATANYTGDRYINTPGTIVVTSEDGLYTKTYDITVSVKPDSIAFLRMDDVMYNDNGIWRMFPVNDIEVIDDTMTKTVKLDHDIFLTHKTKSIKFTSLTHPNGSTVTSNILNGATLPYVATVTSKDGTYTESYNIDIERELDDKNYIVNSYIQYRLRYNKYNKYIKTSNTKQAFNEAIPIPPGYTPYDRNVWESYNDHYVGIVYSSVLTEDISNRTTTNITYSHTPLAQTPSTYIHKMYTHKTENLGGGNGSVTLKTWTIRHYNTYTSANREIVNFIFEIPSTATYENIITFNNYLSHSITENKLTINVKNRTTQGKVMQFDIVAENGIAETYTAEII